MKVGIMSMQRVENYGSFLQSFGLKKTIENMGHNVVFVDYTIEKPIVAYEKPSFLYRLMREIYHLILEKVFKKENMLRLYRKKYLPLLGASKKKNIRDNVDVLVIGSDEVFNCL